MKRIIALTGLMAWAFAARAEEPMTPQESIRKTIEQAKEGSAPAVQGEEVSPEELAQMKEFLRTNLEMVIGPALKEKGLEGRVHAAILDKGVVIFQVVNPFAEGLSEQLTDFRIYPLRLSPEQLAELKKAGLRRNDYIKVKGEFASVPPHIEVESVEITARTDGRTKAQNYELRQMLAYQGKKDFTLEVLVHASMRDGQQVAVDHLGNICSLTLKSPDDAVGAKMLQDLWRFDIVRVPIKEVRPWPVYPPHFVLDSSKKIEVVESIKDFLNFDPNQPDKQLTIEGPLVRIETSSGLLNRESWGVSVKSKKSSLSRQFLLWNFEDLELQVKLEDKLRKWWDAVPGDKVGRNRNIHPNLYVRAKGKLPMFNDAAGTRNQGNHFFHVYDLNDIQGWRIQPRSARPAQPAPSQPERRPLQRLLHPFQNFR